MKWEVFQKRQRHGQPRIGAHAGGVRLNREATKLVGLAGGDNASVWIDRLSGAAAIGKVGTSGPGTRYSVSVNRGAASIGCVAAMKSLPKEAHGNFPAQAWEHDGHVLVGWRWKAGGSGAES